MGTRPARLGDEAFFLGGEFHYFRVPRQHWAHRLSLVAAAGCQAVSVYVPWNWHCPDEATADFTAETVPERNLPGALREIAAAGLSCVLRPGPFITAEWRGGGIPAWLWRDHPEVLARRADGTPTGTEPYPAITYDSPAYREACARWYGKVLPVAAPFCGPDGPVVNIQLDDEPSYWQRLLDPDPGAVDHSPQLLEPARGGPSRYGRWLLEQYGDLAAVNAAHRTRAATPADLTAPTHAPLERSGLRQGMDWLDFKLSRIDEHVAFLHDLVAGSGIDVPVSVLFPYFLPLSASRFRRRSPGDRLPVSLTNEVYLSLFGPASCHEAKLAHAVSTQEAYHLWRGEDPPVTIEVQASNASYLTPGAMEMLYAASVARGIRGLCFYMMVGGANPEGFELGTGTSYDVSAPIAADGRTRPHYSVIRKLADIVAAAEPLIMTATPDRDIWVGWWVPYELIALAGAYGAYGDVAEQMRTTFSTGEIGTAETLSFQTLASVASVSYGYLDLDAADADSLAGVGQLWVPAFEHLPARVQQVLANYARSGGNLVLLPGVPTRDDDDQPCRILAELVWPDGRAPDYRPARLMSEDVERVRAAGGELLLAPAPVTVLPTGDGIEVLAHLDGQPEQACALRRQAGEGTITVVGFRLQYVPTESDEHVRFLRSLLVRPQGVSAAPAPLSAMRLRGQGGSLLCVANPVHLPVSGTVTIASDDPAVHGGRSAGGQPTRRVPAVLESMTLPGPGARLLPLDLDLGHDAVLRYATFELVGRAGDVLTLAADAGQVGEVALEGASLAAVKGAQIRATQPLPGGPVTAAVTVLTATAERIRLTLAPDHTAK